MFLPDLNVLIALAWPNHIHHRVAIDWFVARKGELWHTCSLTQKGFIRLSSNPRVVIERKTPREALSLLKLMAKDPDHRFLDTVWDMTEHEIPEDLLHGYRQVTDCYLAGLACFSGLTLITLDSSLKEAVAGSEWDGSVALIS